MARNVTRVVPMGALMAADAADPEEGFRASELAKLRLQGLSAATQIDAAARLRAAKVRRAARDAALQQIVGDKELAPAAAAGVPQASKSWVTRLFVPSARAPEVPGTEGAPPTAGAGVAPLGTGAAAAATANGSQPEAAAQATKGALGEDDEIKVGDEGPRTLSDVVPFLALE